MFAGIRATQRNKLTNSLFSSTFAICFMLVGANSLIPCPMDNVHGNESVLEDKLIQDKIKNEAKQG